MTKSEYEKLKKQGAGLFKKSGIYLTPDEEQNLEVTDFGLNELYVQGQK